MIAGNLYIVATPIGNLSDITIRAIETLKNVDAIYAEDTRVLRKLADKHEILTPLKIYHEHSKENVYQKILASLESGQNIALVSDAGTPGISDPGTKLVSYIRESNPDIKVIPIPGASALVSALSVSGLGGDSFTFLGFPPHKKGRETFFKNLASIEVRPVVMYESTHRLGKALSSIAKEMGEGQRLVVAKEITKMHEEIFWGTAGEACGYFSGVKSKGEFVIIIP